MIVEAFRIPREDCADFGFFNFVGYMVDPEGKPIEEPVVGIPLSIKEGVKKGSMSFQTAGRIIAVFGDDGDWEVALEGSESYAIHRLDCHIVN